MSTPRPQACQRLLRVLLAGIWVAASWAWMVADRLPRDGDEEGHVGAAELFLVDLAGGSPGSAAQRLAWGDTGEYPGVFPALVGGWWATVQALAGWEAPGDPGRPAVRVICLVGLLLAAWATGRTVDVLAAPDHARAPTPPGAPGGTVAFASVLCLPLATGLSRHFMPEGLLVGVVALAVFAAVRRPSAGAAIALGVVFGVGILVKQTFLLAAPLPVALASRRMGSRLVFAVAAATVVAGPWSVVHLDAQRAYLAGSAGSTSSAPLLDHALYYPMVAATLGLGPVLAVAAIAAALALLRDRSWRPLLLGLAWLLGGMLVLALIPKKYPRLLAPLTPAVALWLGAAATNRRRLWAACGAIGLAAGWLALGSLREVPSTAGMARVDDHCMQRWLRPPNGDDLGLGAVLAASRAAPEGPLVVVAAPQIPCEVQTTPGWADHLSPLLEREGAERRVIAVAADPAPNDAAVVVDWSAPPTEWTVRVPALGGGFALVIAEER